MLPQTRELHEVAEKLVREGKLRRVGWEGSMYMQYDKGGDMKNVWENIKYFIYAYGFWAGIVLILLPIASDVIWAGARNALYWAVGVKGMLCQMAGVALMLCGGRDPK